MKVLETSKKIMVYVLVFTMLITIAFPMETYADVITAQNDRIVLTLGADLSKEQKEYVLNYFGISEDDVITVTITNDDEREQLGGLIPDEQIGTHTYSCALIRPTSGGGVQVKTANLSYVTSNMIASTLSTSGVYNCEVLTVAPFMVSGTGALTGVMMAYAEAMGVELDPEMQELANEEIVLTGKVAEEVGQDQATLIVNDIKIHIIRDQVEDEDEIVEIVDEVIETTENAAEEAGVSSGTLGEVERKKLYDYGKKVADIDYNYKDVQRTLERVTFNITKNSGIKDPIIDTFSTIADDEGLLSDSILLGTNDDALGDDANINATNSVALGDHPAEIIPLFKGDATVTSAGTVKADRFISGTDLVAYKDLNGSYALMDLNGNMLTEAKYTDGFSSHYGIITGSLNDNSRKVGALASDGTILIPFEYEKVEIIGSLWGMGFNLKETNSTDDYDYSSSSTNYVIDKYNLYYFGDNSVKPVAVLEREDFYSASTWGEYINIKDRNGLVTTYNSKFENLREANGTSDFGDYNTDTALTKAISKATGLNISSTFKGNYCIVYDKNGNDGICDRYGNIIIPTKFEYVMDYEDSLMVGGYCGAILNDKFVYVMQDGEISGSFNYSNADVYYYGMSSKIELDNGGFVILAGDGIETKLSKSYSYLSPLRPSKGMLYVGSNDGKYDLIDWHGNILIEDSSDITISSNGNYIISKEGYTSSTLYMINDASPVRLASTAGGASEVKETKIESASMDTYTGEPSLRLMGSIDAYSFIGYSDTLIYRSNSNKYGLMGIDGKKYTKALYDNLEYKRGYIKCEQNTSNGYKAGVLTVDGVEVVPCEYDYVDILNEYWIFATTLSPATEQDYDFTSYFDDDKDKYKMINKAAIFHTPGYDLDKDSEVLMVSLTRDMYADSEVDGEYINIKNRKTGIINTYNSEFENVASVDSIGDFKQFSSDRVLSKSLADKTGYKVDRLYKSGYATVYTYDSNDNILNGVVNMEGNLLAPVQYQKLLSYNDEESGAKLADGYFCVTKDDYVYYITENGKVTCDTGNIYGDDYNFDNYGIAGKYKDLNGKYTIVSADGKSMSGYESASGFAKGLIWKTYDGKDYTLRDWHGNTLLTNFYSVDVSDNGHYMLVKEDYDSLAKLYEIMK